MRERKREILKRIAKKRSSKAIASLIGASLIAGTLSRNRRKKEERKRYLEAIGETFFFSGLPGKPRKPRGGGDSAPGMPGKPFGGNHWDAFQDPMRSKPVGGLPGTPISTHNDPTKGGDSAPDMPGNPIGTNKLPAADPFAPDPAPRRPEKPKEEPREPSEQEKKRQGDLAGKSRDYTDLKKEKRELSEKLAKLKRLDPNRHGGAYPDFLPGETEEDYKKTLEEAEDLYEQLKGAGEIDSEAEDVLEYIGGGALEIPEPELPPIEYVE